MTDTANTTESDHNQTRPTQLGMFAKYWQPGKVKTRLAASIGEQAAAQIHKASVQTLLTRFNNLADTNVLAISPWDRNSDFANLLSQVHDGDRWNLQPQADGDLGARIRDYFDESFRKRIDSQPEQGRAVVLIGSDSPTIPTSTIQAAFHALQTNEVVLGPAEDGGYYLVGAKDATPDIFDAIEWSSEHVWDQTITQLDQLRLQWSTLPPCYDIDRLEDLQRLNRQLTTPEFSTPIWNNLRATVNQAKVG